MVEYKQYIKTSIEGKNNSNNNQNLVVFCHYDANGKIYDYVLHCLKDLAENVGSDIYFVSNAEEIPQQEIEKILPYVKKIIIRKNYGYDFAAYMTGFFEAENKEKYKNITFCNDSVYGPFYSLKEVYNKFDNDDCDIWGITDNIYSKYFLQSWFICLKIKKSISVLENFFENFIYYEDKDEIIKNYEVGLSQKLIKEGLKLKPLCSQYELIAKETLDSDETIDILKKSIVKHRSKKNFRSILSAKRMRYLNQKEFHEKYIFCSQYCSWYTSIKYFKNPFIKCALINDGKLFYYHRFLYPSVIEESYPEFDINLIHQHSHIKRELNLKRK